MFELQVVPSSVRRRYIEASKHDKKRIFGNYGSLRVPSPEDWKVVPRCSDAIGPDGKSEG